MDGMRVALTWQAVHHMQNVPAASEWMSDVNSRTNEQIPAAVALDLISVPHNTSCLTARR